MSHFGDFVKDRREELGLDQAGLARQLGVNQQTVSKWEQASSVPRPQRIQRLAEVLRVDVTTLMRYAGYLPDSPPAELGADDPLHRLLGQMSGLTNEQLLILLDQAWKEYRLRSEAGLQPRRPARRRGAR